MRQGALIAGILLHLILPLASAVSLSDFKQLPQTVSVTCTIAYDRTIPGCTDNDFEGNNLCSTNCVAGLTTIGNGVIESCGGVVASSSSLLGRIFKGAIISALCPDNPQSTSSAAKQTPTSAATQASTSASAKATTTASSTAASSSTTSSTSSSSAAAAQSSSSSSSSAASVASNVQSSSASSSASVQQSSNSSPKLTVQQAQIAAIAHSGGGSPFDIIGYSSASRLSQQSLGLISTAVALIWAGVLLAR